VKQFLKIINLIKTYFVKLIYKYNVVNEEYKHSCYFDRQTANNIWNFCKITYIISGLLNQKT